MDYKPPFLSAPPTITTTTVLRQRAGTGPPSPDNSIIPTRNGSFKVSDDIMSPRLNEFEFQTNKAFSGHLEFNEGREKCRVCGDLPPTTMAFADELFVNGSVMPLKLPPRLQGHDSDKSHVSPLKSPRTRIPFARKGSWAGDFDPFMTALEKVREENRGRTSHHKRSRSHSPFRAVPKFIDTVSGQANQDTVVREETDIKNAKSLLLGKRVGSIKIEDSSDKPVESKVQKLKGFLLKYATFGKDNKQTKDISKEVRKPGYFNRLSFRFKGNGQKKMPADSRMTIVEYNPAFTVSDG